VKTALLVIDVQSGLTGGAHNEISVLSNINELISITRAGNGLVVFVQHCHTTFEPLMKGNPGWQLHPSLHKEKDDLVIEKTASDSFYETALDIELAARNVDHVMVAGLQTEYCVDTTCRSALSRHYSVTLISDAHTTGDSHLPAAEIIDHHNRVLKNLAHPAGNIEVKATSEI